MSASRQTATLPSSDSAGAAGDRRRPARRTSRGATARLGLHHLALAGVLVLSAIVNTHRLSQNGYGNIFYSAGDKSMLRSLHNFFFVSFDPGGLVTVDKPPLGLWVQAASAKLFGFSPLSLLLPEAILGMLAVLLLYRALARRIGGWAGVAGALALAVFPSFVAVSRTTNVDTLLIVLMILACDAGVRARRERALAHADLQRRARRPGVQHEDARRLSGRARHRARGARSARRGPLCAGACCSCSPPGWRWSSCRSRGWPSSKRRRSPSARMSAARPTTPSSA